MNRRAFVFGSLKAALLLSPVLSLRRAAAQVPAPKRVVFWVFCSGYPNAADFFPSSTGSQFQLPPILAGLQAVQNDLVVIDGIAMRDSGLNPRSNNHIRSMGKLLTAKDVLPHATSSEDAEPGGISIDQLIARDLNLKSLELIVNTQAANQMRGRPFATGARQLKSATFEPTAGWDKMFDSFQPMTPSTSPGTQEAVLRPLRARKSLLDQLTPELKRFRTELDGAERLKLDIHEDAIRRAEQSLAADLEAATGTPGPVTASCTVPVRPANPSAIPARAKAHSDVLFAALACNRVQVGGMVWGSSGYTWRYEWLPAVNTGNVHEEVHHRASAERAKYTASAAWDWAQLGAFAKRLKDTPEGSGTMLDNTLIVAVSHFGLHHQISRIPAVLIGNAQGKLQTKRSIKLSAPVHNDRLLTSVGRLMGLPLSGFGDDPNCGPLQELGV